MHTLFSSFAVSFSFHSVWLVVLRIYGVHLLESLMFNSFFWIYEGIYFRCIHTRPNRTFIFGKYYRWHYNKLAHDTLNVLLSGNFLTLSLSLTLFCSSRNMHVIYHPFWRPALNPILSPSENKIYEMVYARKALPIFVVWFANSFPLVCSFKRHMQKCHMNSSGCKKIIVMDFVGSFRFFLCSLD